MIINSIKDMATAQPLVLTNKEYQALRTMLHSVSHTDIYTTIVTAPFTFQAAMAWLFMGFICLYIVDDRDRIVHLKAVSPTEQYKLSVEHYDFKPQQYHVSLDNDPDNTIVQAVQTGKPATTTDWLTLSRSHANPEAVQLNQANSGIAYTVLYPLSGKTRGAVMYNYYQYPISVGEAQWSFMEQYTRIVSRQLG